MNNQKQMKTLLKKGKFGKTYFKKMNFKKSQKNQKFMSFRVKYQMNIKIILTNFKN